MAFRKSGFFSRGRDPVGELPTRLARVLQTQVEQRPYTLLALGLGATWLLGPARTLRVVRRLALIGAPIALAAFEERQGSLS
jgi:hypothetical protein